MAGPEEILKFLDRNPRATALALFAVLVAGAIAGGLYITSLKDALTNERELSKARVEIVSARYQADKEAMSRRFDLLSTQVAAMDLASNRVREALAAVQLVLVQANLNLSDPQSTARLAVAHEELDVAQRQLSQSTAVAAALASLDKPTGPSSILTRERTSNLIVGIAAVLFLLLSTIGIAWFRRRSKAEHPATGAPAPNPRPEADS